MIDINAHLGHWPFRSLPGSDAPGAVRHYRRAGFAQVWVGSFEGLFNRDVAGVNARLADVCREQGEGLLLPFGTVNPVLPDWEEDLRRCHEVHQFRGIRLHPRFHGYDLQHPSFAELLRQAAQRGLVVQLVAMMEDERTQHPMFRVPAVDLAPLETQVKQFPQLRLVVLNAFRVLGLDAAARLAAAGQVSFDIGMLEGVDRLSALVDKVGPKRILLGTHFPLFYVESALLKLRETILPAGLVDLIQSGNAQSLLAVT
ncbi:MAG: amidohydrolase family protein [Planctomycetales bacterium]